MAVAIIPCDNSDFSLFHRVKLLYLDLSGLIDFFIVSFFPMYEIRIEGTARNAYDGSKLSAIFIIQPFLLMQT